MKYKIKIKGHMDEKWADWFGGLQITHDSDGTTTLFGNVVDQAALQGILKKITNLNLELISVKQIKLDAEDKAPTNSAGGADAD